MVEPQGDFSAMLAEFQSLIHAAEPQIIQAPDGRHFVRDRNGNIVDLPPFKRADALVVTTLGAVVSYLEANRDGLDLATHILHVESESQVSVLGPLSSERKRETVLVSKALVPNGMTPESKIGWMDLEDFIVWVGTAFVADMNASAIVDLLSHIDVSEGAEIKDDGLSQTVVTKTGAATRGRREVPNPVTLRPFVTFPEIDQPAREFLLRLKSQGVGKTPLVRFIATGSAEWKIDTRDRIARWLIDEIKLPEGTTVPIIG